MTTTTSNNNNSNSNNNSTSPSSQPQSSIEAQKISPSQPQPPRRYIYNANDMNQFRKSSTRNELLSFAKALGRSCIIPLGESSNSTTTTSSSSSKQYKYNPSNPLIGLSPSMCALHGSLRGMAEHWVKNIPADQNVKSRFGNVSFRKWHSRLVQRSENIINCILDQHEKYHTLVASASASASSKKSTEEGNESSTVDITTTKTTKKMKKKNGGIEGGGESTRSSRRSLITNEMLEEASIAGYRAAVEAPSSLSSTSTNTFTSNVKGKTTTTTKVDAAAQSSSGTSSSSSNRQAIVTELRAYFESSFGHPVRIDYGTGHESSFIVFLYSLCRIGCFNTYTSSNSSSSDDGVDSGGGSSSSGNDDDNNDILNEISLSQVHPPSVSDLHAVALSIFTCYLQVTRSVQTDYILEPAGTHGVWGLDDYHCLPFYIGACQLTNNIHDIVPASIHDDYKLNKFCDAYMYLGCIKYIKSLKKGVPFFESSPMLNDISALPTWNKVSSGLLRLYEGEVLDKLPVVQHFVFGNIFKATWTPSQEQPRLAPERIFINGPGGDECIAPWAKYSPAANAATANTTSNSNNNNNAAASGGGGGGNLPPPTRAPWAK